MNNLNETLFQPPNMLSPNLHIVTHGNATGFEFNGQWASASAIRDGILDKSMAGISALYLCACEVGQGEIPNLIETRYNVPVYSTVHKLRGGELWELNHGEDKVVLTNGLKLPSSLILSSYSLVDSKTDLGFYDTVTLTPAGDRVVVGRRSSPDSSGEGSFRIYDVSPSGIMTLSFSFSSPTLGWAADISNDGTLVAVTAPGRLLVYQETAPGTWTQIYSDTDSGANYGVCCAVSGDGTKIFVGDNLFNSSLGRIYVYDFNGIAVTKRTGTGIITGENVLGSNRRIGCGIASSFDGNTILTIGNGANNEIAGRYTWNGTAWTRVGNNFALPPGASRFYPVIAMSDNGNSALICSGSTTTSYFRIYDWNGSIWILRGNTITGTRFSNQGAKGYISNNGQRVAYGSTSGSGTGPTFYSYDSSTTTWQPVTVVTTNDIRGDITLSESANLVIVSRDTSVSSYLLPTSLITTVNDNYVSSPFNINPTTSNLTRSDSILDNDTNDPAQVLSGNYIITPTGLNAQASISASGVLSITSSHATSSFSFSFTYTQTDSLGNVSNSSTVSYRVINFGLMPNHIVSGYPGEIKTFQTNDTVIRVGVTDGEITATPGAVTNVSYQPPAPGNGGSLFNLRLGANTPGTAALSVVALGYTLGATIDAIILAPTATAGSFSVTLDGDAGATSSGSVRDVATFVPNAPTRFPIVVTSSIPGVTINTNGTITVSPGTAAGTYSPTYQINYSFNTIAVNNLATGTATVIVTTGSAVVTPIAAPDDFIGMSYNINADFLFLGGPTTNIIANDTIDSSVTSYTINPVGLNAKATISPTGDLSVSTAHPLGRFSFTYTITDQIGGVSNSVTVNYRVIDFGPKPALTGTGYPGDDITLAANDFIYRLGMSDNEITVTPAVMSGGVLSPIAVGDGSSSYNFRLGSPGLATASFVFDAVGISFSNSATYTVDTPTATTSPFSLTLNGSVGSTSTDSTYNHTVFAPNLPGRFVVVPGSLPPGITINPDGTLTVDPGTTEGTYILPYSYDYSYNSFTITDVGSGTITLTVKKRNYPQHCGGQLQQCTLQCSSRKHLSRRRYSECPFQ